MRAFARFRLPAGDTRELGHGELIGRLWCAALCLDDPRVSEAHAMVSLRDGALKLLALRGRLAVDGKQVPHIELVPGLRVLLAPDVGLDVEAVQIPEAALAIEGPGLPQQVLSGVCSLVTKPRPALRPGFVGDASAWIWSTGASWSVRLGSEGSARPLLPGDTLEVDGQTFRLGTARVDPSSDGVTMVKGGIASPLRIEAMLDTVHIHVGDGDAPVALSGLSARLISELVAFDGPVAWEILAAEIWPDEDDRTSLRRKLDVNLARLRKKLRDARVRPDLVRAAGTGHFELLLHEQDVVVDRM